MKGFVIKFTEQFWGGLLVGTSLTALLFSSLAFQRIQAHLEFEDELSASFFAAINDVETLKKRCGEQCKDIVLTYPATTTKTKGN